MTRLLPIWIERKLVEALEGTGDVFSIICCKSMRGRPCFALAASSWREKEINRWSSFSHTHMFTHRHEPVSRPGILALNLCKIISMKRDTRARKLCANLWIANSRSQPAGVYRISYVDRRIYAHRRYAHQV